MLDRRERKLSAVTIRVASATLIILHRKTT